MHIAHKHIVALSMLGAVCAALALPRAAVAEDACSFDYVIADGIIPTAFMEVTHTLAERSDMMRAMHAALPNVRRVFAANTGYTALIGWAELPEDYSQYSSMQAVRKLVEMGELSKRTVNAGKDYTYQTGFERPLSIVSVLNYLDGGNRYRDIAMNVIATKHCMLSIKFSGARQPNDDATWQAFGEEFGRIRSAIKDREEPVAFSETGKFFSFVGIVNVVIYVTAGGVVGAVIAFGLTRRYQITPGRAARRYSLAIIVLCLFALVATGFTVYVAGAGFETYDGVWLVPIILAVHANAYMRRSPMAVLAAVSLVIGLFVVSAVYMALGWAALPRTGEAVSTAIGLAMLAYALTGTLARKIEQA